MRRPLARTIGQCLFLLGLAQAAQAQTVPTPAIRNAVIDAAGDSLIITGSGFAAGAVVTLDGQPVTVLPGASDTQLAVTVPDALKVNAGSYRLTISDPATKASDSFVVFTTAPPQAVASTSTIIAPVPSGASAASQGSAEGSGAAPSTAAKASTSIEPALEGGVNTAFGNLALGAVTTGTINAAFGTSAVRNTTSGSSNTGLGHASLFTNTTGANNHGSGAWALYYNVDGSYNAGSGYSALQTNTSGFGNTGTGSWAGYGNQTGNYNVSMGYYAGLSQNGSYNITIGANQTGSSGESNTTRIGYPFGGGAGQNRTFVSGIRGTNVSGGLPVQVDAAGQLGNAQNGPYFTSAGWVGVGVAAPETKLQVSTGANEGIMIKSSTTQGILYTSGLGGGSFAIGTQSNHPIIFGTNNGFDRLTLATNGNVGIGTTTPVAKLEVASTINNGVRFTDGTTVGIFFPSGLLSHSFAIGTQTNHPIVFGTGDTWGRLTIATSGYIGMGTMTPSQPLEMASGAYVSAGGVWTNASSRSLKDQILDLPASRAMDAFAKLQPVTFVYKAEPTQTHLGFIAEDVPELVATNDRKSLSAMDVVALVTKVVQVQRDQLSDQQRLISEQQDELAATRALVTAQEAVLSELRSRLEKLESGSTER
jgi:hypothetical protein